MDADDKSMDCFPQAMFQIRSSAFDVHKQRSMVLAYNLIDNR